MQLKLPMTTPVVSEYLDILSSNQTSYRITIVNNLVYISMFARTVWIVAGIMLQDRILMITETVPGGTTTLNLSDY